MSARLFTKMGRGGGGGSDEVGELEVGCCKSQMKWWAFLHWYDLNANRYIEMERVLPQDADISSGTFIEFCAVKDRT